MRHLRSPSPIDPQAESIPDFVPHFHRLVEQYSALTLTRASDRLPAFSGLAERMQHFRGTYLAGLWADSLCFDLTWRIDKHDLWATRSTRPIAYTGPTWSWVSSIAPVQYWVDTINYTDTVDRFLRELNHGDGRTSTPLLLNKAKTTHSIRVPGKNPFGSVDAGILTLQASSVTAILRYTHYYTTTSSAAPVPYFSSRANVRDNYRVGYHADISHSDTTDETISADVFADYIFSVKGPFEVPEGAELTLLLVHPDVALVLRRKVRAGEYVMVEGEVAWERIGIARVSSVGAAEGNAELGDGMVDWMRGAEVRTFKVV